MTIVKAFAIAAAGIAATAGAASANNAFPFGETFEQTDVLNLPFVTTEGAGSIAIYDFHNGERGELLGMEELRAGVNTNVKVKLGLGANKDILAVLNVGGEEVLIKDYEIR